MFKLSLLILFIILYSHSYAQVSEKVTKHLLTNGRILVEIPYNNEKSALNQTWEDSLYIKNLSEGWQIKKDSISKNKSLTYSITFNKNFDIPSNWNDNQIFIFINPLSDNITLSINKQNIVLTEHSIYKNINITSLINSTINNNVEITVKANKPYTHLKELIESIALFSTPKVHISFFYNHYLSYGRHPRSQYFVHGMDLFYRNSGDNTWYVHHSKCRFKIYNQEGNLIKESIFKQSPKPPIQRTEGAIHYAFDNVNYQRWTAETPVLHSIIIEDLDSSDHVSEVIYEKVGFREVKVQNNKLILNRIPIQVKAVYFDQVYSKDQLKEVIKEIKRHNINTLLVPWLSLNADLYEVCDEYGLYIIQIIDLKNRTNNNNNLSDKVKLKQPENGKECSISRNNMLTNVDFLKNKPSLIGWYFDEPTVTDELAPISDSIKAIDPARPIIFSHNNAVSNLVINLKTIKTWSALTDANRADLKKENQWIDFKIQTHTENTIHLTNRYDFLKLDFAAFHWEIIENNTVIGMGEIDSIHILAQKTQIINLPFSFSDYKNKNNVSFRFSLKLNSDTIWAEPGYEIAWEKFIFNSYKNDYFLINE